VLIDRHAESANPSIKWVNWHFYCGRSTNTKTGSGRMHGETNERIGRRLLVDDRSSHLQYLLQGISVLQGTGAYPALNFGDACVVYGGRQTINHAFPLHRRAGRVIPACCAVDVSLGYLPASTTEYHVIRLVLVITAPARRGR
jgi:hypothetical protein